MHLESVAAPGNRRPPLLVRLLRLRGAPDRRVLVGPRCGEDAAVVALGRLRLVLKSDPVTFTSTEVGWYVVQVNANDVAVMGARPSWFQPTILLPPGTAPARAIAIAREIDRACRALGIAVTGGHTEVTDAVARPIVAGDMQGLLVAPRIIGSAGARTGDLVLMTKAAGPEGTAILATERGRTLGRSVPHSVLRAARGFRRRPGISVVREALVGAWLGVSAMHDPTEGGVRGRPARDRVRAGRDREGPRPGDRMKAADRRHVVGRWHHGSRLGIGLRPVRGRSSLRTRRRSSAIARQGSSRQWEGATLAVAVMGKIVECHSISALAPVLLQKLGGCASLEAERERAGSAATLAARLRGFRLAPGSPSRRIRHLDQGGATTRPAERGARDTCSHTRPATRPARATPADKRKNVAILRLAVKKFDEKEVDFGFEHRAPPLFEPDVLMPSQYFDRVKRREDTPERRLMVAVLEMGVNDYLNFAGAPDRERQGLFREAEQWVEDRDPSWVFSFEGICHVLGLDADYLRRGLHAREERALGAQGGGTRPATPTSYDDGAELRRASGE